MDITNKTRKPLSVPLPGGKKLFLAPGKSGQIAPKAVDFPPLAKLVEAGDIETSGGRGKQPGGGGVAKNAAPTGQRHGGTGAMRQSGDR